MTSSITWTDYIDLHSEENGCDVSFLQSPNLLSKVPFRALIPKGSSRLTVAGRILSAEKIAFAGIRAQCTCMAMGQAAYPEPWLSSAVSAPGKSRQQILSPSPWSMGLPLFNPARHEEKPGPGRKQS